MNLTKLLPDDLAAAAPDDLPTVGAVPRAAVRRDAPLPGDPAGVSLDQLVTCVRAHTGHPNAGEATAVVRGWPADLRRRVALRLFVHLTDDPTAAPDDFLVREFERLVDDKIVWSRADLAWSLRAADEYLNLDGGGQVLPALIAAGSPASMLDGFGPALQALFDYVLGEHELGRYAKSLILRLLGEAMARARGALPYHLLNYGDDFGRAARGRLREHRIPVPEATLIVDYAATLAKPVPAKAWLRAAAELPESRVPGIVLDALAEGHGYLNDDNDTQARGLVWLLTRDPSAAATATLAGAALAACAAPGRSGNPYAPRTATASVEALADRPGDTALQTLTGLAETVTNRRLLLRVEAAVARLT